MKSSKRAFLYLSRKKGKTLRLFFLIFVVAVFLISCFGVLRGSKRLREEIRTSLGAAFYIRANTEVSMKENGETQVKENHVHITQKEIDEMMGTGEIKYCNPINYGFAKSDALQFIPGDKHTEENNMGKVTALRFSALAPDFAEETAVLTEGRHITEGDKGKILISEQLARNNHISVGDSLTLTHARLGESEGTYIDEIPVKSAYAEVQVSGIYKRNTQEASVKPTAGIGENEIYGSLDVLEELQESKASVYTGEVDFYITDPARLDRVTCSVRAISSIDWTTHVIRTNDFRYSRIAERVSSLGDLVKILLVLVSAVSGLVLVFLLTMRMRGRMQEAGILLSLGMSKGQIVAGFVQEVLMVAVVALGISYMVSFGLAGFLEDHLFRALQPNLLNEKTLAAGVDGAIPMEPDLWLSGIETFVIYLCQLLVITASTFLASIMIMRLKPKEILSKMS